MRGAALLVAGGLALAGARGQAVWAAEAPADTLRLGLREALVMALERNPAVAVQRLEPAIAQTYVRQEGAAFEPQLEVSASKSETKSQRFLGSNPSPFELTSERLEYDVTLSGDLPTGTALSASASISGSLSSIYTDQYIGDLGVTVTQSLLRGLGPAYRMADLRRARLDADISRLELKAVAEQVTAEVERAYWDLYLADQERGIRARSLDLAQAQLGETIERVAVGRLAELELAAVRAEAAVRREGMIDAQSRYEQARLHLLYLLNPGAGDAWNLVPEPADRPFVPADSLEPAAVHEQLASRYRADLAQARLDLAKGQLEVSRTRNGLLPRLDLFITLGRTTYAQSFGESVPDPGSPFYNVAAGATFELPLTNREARARHARARYGRDQLELALDNMGRLVQRDVRSAYVEVGRSRQQIEATRVSRDLQEQKLSAEQEKFRVGKSTNLLVLQVQRDFIASQLDEARAAVVHLEALVDLHLMEGTLLERRGISAPAGGATGEPEAPPR